MSKPASHTETISFIPRPGEHSFYTSPDSNTDGLEFLFAGGIWGFAWEADECARQIRDGKIESERMPLNQTLLMMETFDEIRKQGQLIYPESIETIDL